MSIHAIIWDLGGVLVRTEDFTPRDRLAARLGMSRAQLDRLVFGGPGDYRAQLGEISYAQHWEALRRQLDLGPDELAAMQRDYFAGDVLDVGLVDYIRALKADYYTALLSNALSILRSLINEQWKIDDAFHAMVISAEVGLMKPDPAIYHLALEQVGVEPGEAVFIDDHPDNVAGARDVGMHAIHFQGSQQAMRELQALLDSPVG